MNENLQVTNGGLENRLDEKMFREIEIQKQGELLLLTREIMLQ